MVPRGLDRHRAGHRAARPAGNSGGAVYLFRLLAAAADALGRLHQLNLGLFTLPVQMQIDNFDVSPFLCGVIALSLLYSAYASQTLRGALKAVPQGQWESGQALGLVESQRSSSVW